MRAKRLVTCARHGLSSSMRRRVKWLLPLLPLLLLALAHADRDPDSIGNWRNASRAPVGLAPDPAVTPEGVVQVYAARAVRWRGYFGVHTWIAAKPANAPAFTVYEVTGFRVRSGGRAVTISQRAPDGRWFGSAPKLLADVRGPGVGPLLERIEHVVATYPYDNTYRIWPGPNSNTFTAFVLRHVPELRVDLPANAVGKDYLGARVFARAERYGWTGQPVWCTRPPCWQGRRHRTEPAWPDVRSGSERPRAEAAAR